MNEVEILLFLMTKQVKIHSQSLLQDWLVNLMQCETVGQVAIKAKNKQL